ncbi:hypothetical protein CDIK_0884 [Cucumispora dikerogammari]|nr:hypothetical protein CDIK_0884 [Cucumispora dikerogammari]
MPKSPKILNEIKKHRIISFLMSNTLPLELSSIERLRFKKKARLFVFENGLLMIIKNNVKKNYIYEHETARMRRLVIYFTYLSIEKNALREAISTQYIGVSTKFIYNYVNPCISCQRESVHVPTTPLTSIMPNFKKRD